MSYKAHAVKIVLPFILTFFLNFVQLIDETFPWLTNRSGYYFL